MQGSLVPHGTGGKLDPVDLGVRRAGAARGGRKIIQQHDLIGAAAQAQHDVILITRADHLASGNARCETQGVCRINQILVIDGVLAVTAVENINIVAGTATQEVVARAAANLVAAAVAEYAVIQHIARQLQCRAAGGRQPLQMRTEHITHGRVHRVNTLVGELNHHITRIIDNITVVAQATTQVVGSGAAVECVVATQTHQNVGA